VVPVDHGRPRKKLIGAARHWLRGGKGEVEQSERVEFARAVGVPEEQIRRQFSPRIVFEVWAENWQIVEVFMMVAETQWSFLAGAARPVVTGLRYESLPVVLDALAVPAEQRRDVLYGVKVMERCAMAEINAEAANG
jgi:hypothetical protein